MPSVALGTLLTRNYISLIEVGRGIRTIGKTRTIGIIGRIGIIRIIRIIGIIGL